MVSPKLLRPSPMFGKIAFELTMRNQDAGGVEVSVSLPFAVAAAGKEI